MVALGIDKQISTSLEIEPEKQGGWLKLSIRDTIDVSMDTSSIGKLMPCSSPLHFYPTFFSCDLFIDLIDLTVLQHLAL